MQPGDTDPIAFLDPTHTGTESRDAIHAFVARDERRSRSDRPVATPRVQIGMADAGRFDAN